MTHLYSWVVLNFYVSELFGERSDIFGLISSDYPLRLHYPLRALR